MCCKSASAYATQACVRLLKNECKPWIEKIACADYHLQIPRNITIEVQGTDKKRPGPDVFGSTNIANIGILSACVFPFLLFFVGLVFVGTLNVGCFFSVCAPEKKQQKFGVSAKSHPTKSMGREKTHAESRFLPCLRSRWRPVLVLLFSDCAILFSG